MFSACGLGVGLIAYLTGILVCWICDENSREFLKFLKKFREIYRSTDLVLSVFCLFGVRSDRRSPSAGRPSKTRNSSGDEIANVNFLYDDIVHVLQNTIDSCINSATDRRGYVLERMCLPWNNAIQRPLRRSRSFKVANFGTNQKLIYDFLFGWVGCTNVTDSLRQTERRQTDGRTTTYSEHEHEFTFAKHLTYVLIIQPLALLDLT